MDVRAELESLKTFRGQLDRILTGLHESAGAPRRIEDHTLGGLPFGQDFGEAHALYNVYSRVHEELKTLSTLLGDQIEAFQTAVLAAQVGYANVDDDLRRRMREIQERTRKLYDPRLDPNGKAAQQEKHPAETKRGAGEGSMRWRTARRASRTTRTTRTACRSSPLYSPRESPPSTRTSRRPSASTSLLPTSTTTRWGSRARRRGR
ncbi:hypothetical protein GCM10010218_18530 [Streptomyces mashuensis]|uniref:Uncharacterized protein n=1 Tax=Streptomyces mashuensis TaxID=33904 RepID=A0A919EC28_9ACTN|nr:hypothetical protein GCM10010218_18530 [Streptomyces mashuensis]